MTASARPHRRWSPHQAAQLYIRRHEGAPLKQLSHEFGRSSQGISERARRDETLLERECREILRKHREEEAALLERLLIEQGSLEVHGDERK